MIKFIKTHQMEILIFTMLVLLAVCFVVHSMDREYKRKLIESGDAEWRQRIDSYGNTHVEFHRIEKEVDHE